MSSKKKFSKVGLMEHLPILFGADLHRGDDQVVLFSQVAYHRHKGRRHGDVPVPDEDPEFVGPDQGNSILVDAFLAVAQGLDAQSVGERGAEFGLFRLDAEEFLLDDAPVALAEPDNFSSGLGLPNSSLVTAPASMDRKAGSRLGYLHARPWRISLKRIIWMTLRPSRRTGMSCDRDSVVSLGICF